MSQDYGKTLNLPQTKFPMRANLPQREPELLKKWTDMDIYNKQLEKTLKNPNSYFMMVRPMQMAESTWARH